MSLILSTKILLDVRALSVSIGRQGILRDVSVHVPEGGWLGIVGGSGAGKSTLLRAIMGLKRPARPISGTMTFDGTVIDLAASKRWRPDAIAYVPQSPAHGLDPLRRLHWQWRQLVRCKGSDNRAVFAALGLPEPGPSYPHQWSLGMQQRLLLAMALVGQPRLLILDEPTSALDPLIAAQVLTAIAEIAQQQNIAVMMVTHDLALAGRFCDRLAIMAQGRVVEAGATDALMTTPQHPYAQQLVRHRHWHGGVDA